MGGVLSIQACVRTCIKTYGFTQVLEVDAAAILFPIPIARRVEALAATDFRGRGCVHDRTGAGFLIRNRRLSGFGTAGFGMKIGLTYDRCIHNCPSLSPTPMSHNRDHATKPDFALPEHAVLALKGPDAVVFAQAQFMNDVGALTDGQWQWNGWLTPKGRVIALFALLRLDAQTLWLLLPDIGAAELASLLQRYVFRSKIVLAVEGSAIAAGFHAPQIATGASFAVIEDRRIELDMSGDEGPRCLVIGGSPVPADHQAALHWMHADLAHGLPRLSASQREQWTPQQLSLDHLRAFSVKKGCYPGQEIVARTHFLGQVKRGLARYDATSSVVVGSEVFAGADRSIGKIICTAGTLALAVVPLDAPTEELNSAGIALKTLPLLGGLAR